MASNSSPSSDPDSEAPDSERAPSIADALPAVAPRYRRITARMLAATLAGAFGVALAASHIARQGTPDARISAAVAIAAAFASVVAVPLVRRRALAKPQALLLAWVAEIDGALAARIGRALALAVAPPAGTSVTLAELHAKRALASLPLGAVDARLATTATRWGRISWGVTLVAVAAFCLAPVRAIEGSLVLAARNGRAPLAIPYVNDLEAVVEPPEHLREPARSVAIDGPISVPSGSRISLRAHAILSGRTLVLRASRTEDSETRADAASAAPSIAFVEDGQGGLVAHLTLTESGSYRVAARFGEVFIDDPQELRFEVVPDDAPTVKLEGAPKRLSLFALGSSESPGALPLRWEASDDHGLREIDLVLRSGDREERRVLAKPDARPRTERGGTMLRSDDPFFENAYAPVEVVIEARDDDPQAGKRWGRSPAYLVVPPPVGERERLRMSALRAVRDAWVDALGDQLEAKPTAVFDAAIAKGHAALQTLKSLGTSKGTDTQDGRGLPVPGRLLALLDAAWSKAEQSAAKEKTGERTRAALERAVSTIDGAVQGTAQKDARAIAEKLSRVADDLFLAVTHNGDSAISGEKTSETRKPANSAAPNAGESDARSRIEAHRAVLAAGGEQLHAFGVLGHDLGEIVSAYLTRFDGARAKGDDLHAALAAKDLAVRLHEPDPSFGARGRSGRSGGGGESGGGDPQEGAGEGGAPSASEQAFQEAAQKVDGVTKDHADQMAKTSKALQDAASDEDRQSVAEAGKKKADELRQALKRLPPVGSGSDSWTQKGAEARDQGEQVARNLEDGKVGDAAERADSALQMLEEARQKARRERLYGGGDATERIDQAAKALEEAKRWSNEQKKELAQKSAARAKGELGKRAEDEGKLADRMADARKSGDGRGQEKALPDSTAEALSKAEEAARRAKRALEKGDVATAEAAQKEAQAALEAAQKSLGSDSDPSSKSPQERDGDGQTPAPGHADIPGKDSHKGPEDFRRRVLEGLAGSRDSGGRKDAVKRYAEGLLR